MKARELNQLFDSARAGDSGAEKQLFAHLHLRFSYFTRQRIQNARDAEEVAQAAMLIVCREYRGLAVTSSFAAWAHQVLENLVIEHFRSAQRYRQRFVSDNVSEDFSSAAVEDLDLKLRLLACLRKIGRTNRSYARALNYRYQGYETEDICRRLEVNETKLYYLLHRCRTMLKNCLKTGKVA